MQDATAPRGTERMSDDAVALAWLKSRIEDLSNGPAQWSRHAYTHRRTPHVAFANGFVKHEGEYGAAWVGSVRDMAEATLQAVRDYRATIDGPVLLTWRAEPVLEDELTTRRIYCRLCFEPDLWA